MCEWLIRWIPGDANVPQGVVSDCQEDAFSWGSKELLAPAQGGAFVVVRLPGVPKSKGSLLVRPKFDKDPTTNPDAKQIGHRQYTFDLNGFNQPTRDTLYLTGSISTTLNTIDNLFIDDFTKGRVNVRTKLT